jgi:hypothetical protein
VHLILGLSMSSLHWRRVHSVLLVALRSLWAATDGWTSGCTCRRGALLGGEGLEDEEDGGERGEDEGESFLGLAFWIIHVMDGRNIQLDDVQRQSGIASAIGRCATAASTAAAVVRGAARSTRSQAEAEIARVAEAQVAFVVFEGTGTVEAREAVGAQVVAGVA